MLAIDQNGRAMTSGALCARLLQLNTGNARQFRKMVQQPDLERLLP
jgi:hypothetical protein